MPVFVCVAAVNVGRGRGEVLWWLVGSPADPDEGTDCVIWEKATQISSVLPM